MAQETVIRPILRSKVFLYITEFISGMAVMAAELGASRLLAPYFSSSQIVWTIIIGTIMIALALGSVWGGRKADRDPNPDKLYMRIMIAAVWIALIPLVGKYLIIIISGLLIVTVSTNFLVIAAFLSCIIIFVPPLFLLGTVTPGLVKFASDSLDNNATVVGRLSACNTIGSILGTFLPTFVTIPAVGTFVTFLIFSGALLVLPIAYFVASRVRLLISSIAVLIFIGSSVFSPITGFAFWERNLAYEGESIYNYLQVKELSDRTILSTNVLFGVQSVTMKQPGLTGMYYDTALAAPALSAHADSALILGMGTGTYARQLRQYYPKMAITGVEIDEKISRLATEYFSEPSDIDVATYDGRAWLAASKATFDVIMVDAYQDITIPFQMSSTQFFSLVKQHLNPGGVMVVNMNMVSSGSGSINEALTTTMASIFGHLNMAYADVPHTTNREVFAQNKDIGGTNVGGNGFEHDGIMTGLDPLTLANSAFERTKSGELQIAMKDVGERAQRVTPASPSALTLTDDKAPVELLGMRAIDQIIEEEAGPYKEILRTQGIQGLINLQ